MLAKRIIPCLDVLDGTTVKGMRFLHLKEAGNPVELARIYSDAGADELVFLDINASHERRKTFVDVVRRVAENISIPFTVGGGIGSVEDVGMLLNAGADKVSINSSALRRPELITEIAKAFGSQVCVVAIDASCRDGEWRCYLNGGRVPTAKKLYSWAKEAEDRGAGEILFTSMDHDGVKEGFALDALKKLQTFVSIPVIASGGCGTMQHFVDAFRYADAALAASVFHFGEIQIPQLKKFLKENNINVR